MVGEQHAEDAQKGEAEKEWQQQGEARNERKGTADHSEEEA